MKPYTLLLLSFFFLLNISCKSQQKNDHNNLRNNSSLLKIELKEQTRGTNRLITFTLNSKIISLNGDIKNESISTNEWKNITEQVDLIELSKIGSFVSPTTGRYSDKALASTIIIYANGKEYTSSTFDAGIPPKELENLYKALMGNVKEKHNPQKK
ncbi:hypothetical protein [Chryseobacterium polytrichastri]|uniref:Uncharacterized protein n=1 Tax=Chryseobacterium polytrichastri TaxID=1302687 RepID=A0A1M7FBG6_9FLAO|nr:hypothetical protein [Chryseobacterium polytrichastri]SHM01059.1 hypothetical protein SAMN05444267_103125 [Chryseobacterium polytrichastri]